MTIRRIHIDELKKYAESSSKTIIFNKEFFAQEFSIPLTEDDRKISIIGDSSNNNHNLFEFRKMHGDFSEAKVIFEDISFSENLNFAIERMGFNKREKGKNKNLCEFINCDFRNAKINQTLENTSFKNCSFIDSSISCKFTSCIFYKCIFFINTTFNQSVFTSRTHEEKDHIVFWNSTFKKTTFIGGTFRDTILSGNTFEAGKFRNTNFRNVNLTNNHFEKSAEAPYKEEFPTKFINSTFIEFEIYDNNNLVGFDAESCSMIGLKFSNLDENSQNLSVTSLKNCDLTGASLPSYLNSFRELTQRHEDACKLARNLLTILLSTSLVILTAIIISLTNNSLDVTMPGYGKIEAKNFAACALIYLTMMTGYFCIYLQEVKRRLQQFPKIFPDGSNRVEALFPWIGNRIIEESFTKNIWSVLLLISAPAAAILACICILIKDLTICSIF